MTAQEHVRDKISEWASHAWPVSSHVSAADAYRRAWGEWGGDGCSLPSFTEILQSLGWHAQLFGSVWLIRLPGPSPRLAASAIRCEGV